VWAGALSMRWCQTSSGRFRLTFHAGFQYFEIVHLACQPRQTTPKFLSTTAMANICWRVRELYCQTSHIKICENLNSILRIYKIQWPTSCISERLID
jgi:hypothetical protein